MSNICKWKMYTPDDLKKIVSESKSYREVAMKIGYSSNGGNSIAAIKQMIEHYSLDCSHFRGKTWKKSFFDLSRFRYGTAIKSSNMLLALSAIRGRCCENCGRTTWFNEDIPLEVHHIDGDCLNNELCNLKLLCRNCHFIVTKKQEAKRENKVSDEAFVLALKRNCSIRQALIELGLSPKGGNYTRAYKLIDKFGIPIK